MVAIHITGVRCRISDQVKSYIADKLGALMRFHTRLSSLHVTIHEGEKRGYRVDVDMHLHSGKDVVAHQEAETLFAAIDQVEAKCATQMRKIHEREVEPQRMRVGA